MRFRKGLRVIRLFEDRTGRFASSHAWVVTRVSKGVVEIGDAHGVSHFTYDLDGRQREVQDGFRSEIVIVRD